MNEKTKIIAYTELVEVDNVFREERRSYVERRKSNAAWKGYERRKYRDPRLNDIESIDVTI